MFSVPEGQSCLRVPRADAYQVRTLWLWHNGTYVVAELENRKDKTLVEVLDMQRSMGAKIDAIYDIFSQRAASSSEGFNPTHSSVSSHILSPTQCNITTSTQASFRGTDTGTSNLSYHHVSAAHKILTWDAIQRMLLQASPSNLTSTKHLESDGSSFLMWIYRDVPDLPLTPLDMATQEVPFRGMQSQSTRLAEGKNSNFSSLKPQVMRRLATSYFDTFNLFYYLLDRTTFMTQTLVRVETEGFSDGIDSTLVLLVLALGELADDSHSDLAIDMRTRFMGSDKQVMPTKPAGLTLFNEARRRIGFGLSRCDLENVQAFSLVSYVSTKICANTSIHVSILSKGLNMLISECPESITRLVVGIR